MKKIIYFLLLTILFIPIIVNAAECDTSKVYIDSISTENQSGYAKELEKAIATDKKINLNLRMSVKDDEVVYKVVLKNDSKEDYEINKNSIKLDTDYIDYSLDSGNSNILKANSTKTIYLRVKYTKEVESNKLVNGVYQDNITMKVNLNSDDTPSNPNTGLPYIIIISLIMIIIGISLIVFKKKKLSTLMILIGILLLPIGVEALCRIEITIDSKVKIQTEDQAKLVYNSCFTKQEGIGTYKIGMTIGDLFDSFDKSFQEYINQLLATNNYEYGVADNEYFDCLDSIVLPKEEDYLTYEEFENAYDEVDNERILCVNKYIHEVDFSNKIKNKDEATYIVVYKGECSSY